MAALTIASRASVVMSFFWASSMARVYKAEGTRQRWSTAESAEAREGTVSAEIRATHTVRRDSTSALFLLPSDLERSPPHLQDDVELRLRHRLDRESRALLRDDHVLEPGSLFEI